MLGDKNSETRIIKCDVQNVVDENKTLNVVYFYLYTSLDWNILYAWQVTAF